MCLMCTEQVVFAVQMVSGISAELAKLVENNKTDATYIVGSFGEDYLIGASSGGTVSTSSVNGTTIRERLSAADSPSDRISSSYHHLSNKFAAFSFASAAAPGVRQNTWAASCSSP